MKAKQNIVAFAAGLVALGGAAVPLFAYAGIFDGIVNGYEATYFMEYGPGTSMCPPYEYNYYSCPSGIGGLFGAQPGYGGGYGTYSTGYGHAPAYSQRYYAHYQPPQPYYYPPQQNYYYEYQPSYDYGYYDYDDYSMYAPSIGSPIIYMQS